MTHLCRAHFWENYKVFKRYLGVFGGAPSFPFHSRSSWLQSSEASIWCQRQWKIVVNWWSLGEKKGHRNRQWGPIVNWLGMYTKSYGMSQRSCLLSPALSSSSLGQPSPAACCSNAFDRHIHQTITHTHKDLLQFLTVPSFSFTSAIWGALQTQKTHSGRHSIKSDNFGALFQQNSCVQSHWICF
jgi:hypothetical protein